MQYLADERYNSFERRDNEMNTIKNEMRKRSNILYLEMSQVIVAVSPLSIHFDAGFL